MNVFYLDHHTQRCAKQHVDKHVVKMIVEYAQLLSTAHRVLDGEEYEGRTANNRRIRRFKMADSNVENTLCIKQVILITQVQYGSDRVLNIIDGCIVCLCGCVLSIRGDMVRFILQKDY